MKLLLLPLALLLAVSAPSAFAGDDHGDKMKCPMHDASLSDAERAAAMDKMFAKMDADANGSISRAEFDQHHEDMRREHEEHAKHDTAAAEDHAGH